MLQLALHLIATIMVAAGGWFTFAGVIATAFPDAVAISDIYAGYRFGQMRARLLAAFVALFGICLFVTGAMVAVQSFL